MNKEIPKPYLQLCGQTILEHTIRRFLALPGLVQLVVATSDEYLETAESLVERLLPESILGECLAGGAERQDSINNALSRVKEVDLVIVHDAVRPLVKEESVERCCETASRMGAAVLGVPVRDTIKKVDDQEVVQETPARKFLWQTQTPQVFRKEILLEAYKKAEEDGVSGTDDASLVERLGQEVKMVEGERSNFKITYPVDLQLARQLMDKKGDE